MASGQGHDTIPFLERLERSTIRGYKRIKHTFSKAADKRHVFVAGMQRSGTNMIMATLDRSLFTDVYHETDPRAFHNYQMRPVHVIRKLSESSNAPCFVIKCLCELDQVSFFLDQFPESKVLWIVRDFRASALSAIRSFSNFAPQLHRLSRDKNSDGWRGRGMSDATQQILKDICSQGEIDELNAAAMMWFYRNVLFFEQKLDQQPDTKIVFYEEIVREPEKIEEIFDFLALQDFGPRIIRHIRRSQHPAAESALRPDVEQHCQELYERFRACKDENKTP